MMNYFLKFQTLEKKTDSRDSCSLASNGSEKVVTKDLSEEVGFVSPQ